MRIKMDAYYGTFLPLLNLMAIQLPQTPEYPRLRGRNNENNIWCDAERGRDYAAYLDKFNKPKGRNHLKIYRMNVNRISQHNIDHNNSITTWWKEVNIFTDMSTDELQDYMGYDGESSDRLKRSPEVIPPRICKRDVPPSLDYRIKSITSRVKNQGKCGCCFAVAAVDIMESKYAMRNITVDLSEQNIVDCIKKNGSGCHGGSFKKTFDFLKDIGVDTEMNNPYTALGNQSWKASEMKHNHRVLEWKEIDEPDNECAMMEALVNYGPIVASITVDEDFRFYGGGAFTANIHSKPNHAIVIVGCREDGMNVWYIKNSWGEEWGEKGYMHLERGVNFRGIADFPFAILSVSNAPMIQEAPRNDGTQGIAASEIDTAKQASFWIILYSTAVITCMVVLLLVYSKFSNPIRGKTL